jgi:transcriptional regulator with XRE-family HTH domain
MANDLKQWRKARNITQEQAAYALGITPRHWQRLEAGHRRITAPIERLLAML